MNKIKKEFVYCIEKHRSGCLAPCHYAWYDRLFELGVFRCTQEPGTCQHQKTAPEDTLHKRWQKKLKLP